MMLPVEHLFQPDATALPALIVVRHPSGGTHFVVIWRRLGGWLQLMDPAIGRRWVRRSRFIKDLTATRRVCRQTSGEAGPAPTNFCSRCGKACAGRRCWQRGGRAGRQGLGRPWLAEP
jgi:hypothetical protein